jgi:hypothetical protein
MASDKKTTWEYIKRTKELIVVIVFILATFAGSIFWVQSAIDSKIEHLKRELEPKITQIQETNQQLLTTAYELKGVVSILKDKLD